MTCPSTLIPAVLAGVWGGAPGAEAARNTISKPERHGPGVTMPTPGRPPILMLVIYLVVILGGLAAVCVWYQVR